MITITGNITDWLLKDKRFEFIEIQHIMSDFFNIFVIIKDNNLVENNEYLINFKRIKYSCYYNYLSIKNIKFELDNQHIPKKNIFALSNSSIMNDLDKTFPVYFPNEIPLHYVIFDSKCMFEVITDSIPIIENYDTNKELRQLIEWNYLLVNGKEQKKMKIFF